MKVYTFSEARQKLAELLTEAREGEVLIKRRNGETFVVRRQISERSPLDVPGVKTRATTKDILSAVQESRSK